jgi:hypothetical protein
VESHRFASPIETTLPPWLTIVFTDEQAGCSTFGALRSKVGREDEEELIRVSLVEGTFCGNPNSYALKIGPDLSSIMKHFHVELELGEYVDFVARSRFNHMNRDGPWHCLKSSFGKAGRTS